MKELFFDNCRRYFGDAYPEFEYKLKEPLTQGIFLNTRKADKETILSLIDFQIKETPYSSQSYYHYSDNIGKTISYELGLIYPQEIAASLSSSYLDLKDIRLIVDMCAAPGGKTINILNRCNNVLCIANDISHSRSLTLSSNLERLGLDNVVITNKDCDTLSEQLAGMADLVILDAPCSGEGMARKYPEIIDNYSNEKVSSCARMQKDLMEDAYRLLNHDGMLIYSTCTYAFAEDEDQVKDFLKRHEDMELLKIDLDSSSRLEGTVKLSPINDTEGQFFAYLHKKGMADKTNIRLLKGTRNKLVESFIADNLILDDYYLYEDRDRFYLSLIPLPDLKNNVIKYGIYAGKIINKRFEPDHNLYRANSLTSKFRYVYDLSDEEYRQFVAGNSIKTKLENHYYQLTYHGLPIGFGKYSDGMIKNKYPKGLRNSI